MEKYTIIGWNYISSALYNNKEQAEIIAEQMRAEHPDGQYEVLSCEDLANLQERTERNKVY